MKKFIVLSMLAMAMVSTPVWAGEEVVEKVTEVVQELPSMNELTNLALNELVTSFVTVKDFTVEQVPLVLKELLRWKFAVSLIGFIACLLAPVGVFLISHKVTILAQAKDFYALNALSLFILIPLFECDTMDWLQIWLAPRVYLIEYAAELVK